MPIYNDKVMEYFMNPRNVGEIEDADGIGEEGNPVCGDMMTFYIKVKDDRIEDVKFKTFGCGAAIAVSSMVSEMAKGKTLDEAMEITPSLVAAELDGLPKNKFHCSNLGAQALQKAIDNYRSKQKPKEKVGIAADKKGEKGATCCPYCDVETTTENPPYCQACGVAISYCPQCLRVVARGDRTCPHCGAEIRGPSGSEEE